MAGKRPKVRETEKTAAPAAPRRRIRIRAEWIAALFALFAGVWLLTEGDWDFYKTSGQLESFYDAQAESLLGGHLDVPEEAIAPEAFTHNGKHYGYFGPTPALFRIPLVALFPGRNGHWSRWSMLAGSCVALAALLLLLATLEDAIPALATARIWTWLKPMFLLTAGVGSTLLFIVSESKVYQESIQWGAALAAMSATFLLRYLLLRRTRWLAAACATAFLSFFARVSSGAGPICALALLDAALLAPTDRFRRWLGSTDLPRPRRAIAMLSATVALTAFLWGALNYWKFGVVFTSQPLELTKGYDAVRLRNVKGNLASFTNVPMTVSTYLSPANIGFSPLFPWVRMITIERQQLAARFPAAHLDVCEFFASLPAGMPALFFSALAGTALAFAAARYRTLRLPLIGAAAGCTLVFLWGLITYRYLQDFFPWLTIGTAVALAGIAQIRRPALRRGLTMVFLMAAAYSMWVNFAFGLTQSRLYAAPVDPEKRIAFLDATEAMGSSGVGAFVATVTRWSEYRAASSAQSAQHLGLYDSDFAPWRIVRPAGPPPYAATYVLDAPSDGVYELAVRYASAEPRPVLLTVNGINAAMVCGAATGGDSEAAQRWVSAGKMRLGRGPVAIGLSSSGDFPALSFLRLTRAD